jgi:hypothetical protein
MRGGGGGGGTNAALKELKKMILVIALYLRVVVHELPHCTFKHELACSVELRLGQADLLGVSHALE